MGKCAVAMTMTLLDSFKARGHWDCRYEADKKSSLIFSVFEGQYAATENTERDEYRHQLAQRFHFESQ
jgi:hypothetical protein